MAAGGGPGPQLEASKLLSLVPPQMSSPVPAQPPTSFAVVSDTIVASLAVIRTAVIAHGDPLSCPCQLSRLVVGAKGKGAAE